VLFKLIILRKKINKKKFLKNKELFFLVILLKKKTNRFSIFFFLMSEETLFIALDIEASGYICSKHFIKAIGAYAVKENGEFVDKIEIKMKAPPGCVREKRCTEEFWDKNPGLWEKLSVGEVSHVGGIYTFWKWIEGLRTIGYKQVKLISDFPEFDVAWINYYVTEFLDKPPLYYLGDEYIGGAMAIDDFIRGLLHIPNEWSVNQFLNELCSQYHLEISPKGDHDPINDAREIALNAVNATKLSLFFKSAFNRKQKKNSEQ